jgi:hypothetical protein
MQKGLNRDFRPIQALENFLAPKFYEFFFTNYKRGKLPAWAGPFLPGSFFPLQTQ